MKYTVKVKVFTQEDVSTNKPGTEINTPAQLESVQSYRIVADILAPGTGSLTPNALKTQLRDKFKIVTPIGEVLLVGGKEVSGSAAIKSRLVEYNVTISTPRVGSN